MPLRISASGIRREYADRASFDVSAITVAAWIKYEVATTTTSTVVRGNGNTGEGEWRLGLNASGLPLFNVRYSSAAHAATAAAVPPLGVWRHYIGRYVPADSQVQHYINNVLDGTAAAGGAIPASTQAVWIGDSTTTGNPANCSIAFVGIWNGGLNEDERQQLVNGVPPHLVRPDLHVLVDECMIGSIDLAGFIAPINTGNLLDTPWDAPYFLGFLVKPNPYVPSPRRGRRRRHKSPPATLDKTLSGSLSILDEISVICYGRVSVQETDTRALVAQLSVQATEEKTISGRVFITQTTVYLDPTSDVSAGSWVMYGGPSTIYECLDDAVRDPANARTGGDGDYVGIDPLSPGISYNVYYPFTLGMPTFTLEGSERVVSVKFKAWVQIGTGNNAFAPSDVVVKGYTGTTKLGETQQYGPSVAFGITESWVTVTWTPGSYAGAPSHSLGQSDIDALEFVVDGRVQPNTSSFVAVYAVYIELTIQKSENYLEGRVDVVETVTVTQASRVSVYEVLEPFYAGRVTVQETLSPTVQGSVIVLGTTDLLVDAAALVPRSYFFRSPDGDVSSGWDETTSYGGQPQWEILTEHESWYLDDFLNGATFDPTGLSHLDIDESSGASPVTSRFTFGTETLSGEYVTLIASHLYYHEAGTSWDGVVSVTVRFFVAGTQVYESAPHEVVVAPGPVSGWIVDSWAPDDPESFTQSDLDSLEVEIEGAAYDVGGAGVHLGLYVLKVRVEVSRGRSTDASLRVVDVVDAGSDAGLKVAHSPLLARPDGCLASGNWHRSDADDTTATMWEAVDDDVESPNDPTTSPPGDGLYVYNTVGAGTLWLTFTSETLQGSEVAVRLQVYVHAEMIGGTGGLAYVLLSNLVILSSDVVATALGKGWYLLEGDFDPDYLNADAQAQLDSLELLLVPSLDPGATEIRIHAAYAYIHLISAEFVRHAVRVVDIFTKETAVGVQVRDSSDVGYTSVFEIRRWLTVQHMNIGASFRVLVEVDWPGGARRYADVPLAVGDVGYEGRLARVDPIVQGTDGRRGSVSFALDNTDDRGAPPEDLWSDSSPPEGAAVRVYYWFVGDSPAQAIEVFRGVVDSVTSVTEFEVVLSAISSEESIDLLLGEEVNAVDYPDAPPASMGKMKPIVFGVVEQLEGVQTTTIAVSSLAGTALKADATLTLEDASRFPNATTTIQVGDEQVTYTGKTGNNLTGVGARVLDYGPGVAVREIGTLEVLFAAHAATLGDVYAAKGDRLRLLDPSEYTESLVGPTTVSFAGGWPTVPVPDGGSDFAAPQMSTTSASGNTATNGNNVCADHASWTDRNYATVASGQTLKVERATAPPSLGEIVRAYAVVEYDGSTVGAGDFRLKSGATDLIGSALTSAGNLSSDLKNRAEALGNTRAYDDSHTITDPNHQHPAPSAVTETIFCDSLTGSSNFNNGERVVDGGLVLGALNNGAAANIRAYKGTTLPDKGTITSVLAKIRIQNISGSSVTGRVISGGSTRITAPAIVNGFDSIVTMDVGAAYAAIKSWAVLNTSGTYIEVTCGALGVNTVIVAEMWWEVTYTPPQVAAAATGVGQSNNSPLAVTVAALGDVTSLAAGDWSWFQSQPISVAHSSGSATLRVVRVYFLVEYAPSRDETADRILADVTGLAPDGEPTEILEAVLTHAGLLGLGAESFNAADFAAAASRLAVAAGGGPYRLDFALTEKVQAVQLLLTIAKQSRLLAWWEEGALCVVFEELRADMGEPVFVFQPNDTELPGVKRSRTVLRDVVNRIAGSYRYDYRERRLSAVAVAEFGAADRGAAEEWPLIRDESTAASLAAFTVDRKGRPRFVADWSLPLPGLEIRRGDLVGIKSSRFEYRKVQMVRIAPDGARVGVTGMVWDDL